jgi:hypothetical protein
MVQDVNDSMAPVALMVDGSWPFRGEGVWAMGIPRFRFKVAPINRHRNRNSAGDRQLALWTLFQTIPDGARP